MSVPDLPEAHAGHPVDCNCGGYRECAIGGITELDRLRLLVGALADCQWEWKHCPVCNYADPAVSGHEEECPVGYALREHAKETAVVSGDLVLLYEHLLRNPAWPDCLRKARTAVDTLLRGLKEKVALVEGTRHVLREFDHLGPSESLDSVAQVAVDAFHHAQARAGDA